MVVMEACCCSEGFGLAHSHIQPKFEVVNKTTNVTFWMDEGHVEMNQQAFASDGHLGLTGNTAPAHIVIWVNWKDVARAVMSGG
jgi:hypothetical protein